MNRTIEQLLGGRYEYSVTPPLIEPERIEGETAPGADVRGRVVLRSADGQRLRGHGHVTDARIVLAQDHFTGTEIRISYGVDVRGLRDGDVVEGKIVLSLNAGEILVPVRIRVAKDTEKEEALSLPAFAALARNDFREAFRVFSSDRMEEVLAGEDGRTRAMYRALSAGTMTYQRLEEFLVATGMKEAVRFTADREQALYEHLRESTQGVLHITKNTWGNVNLTARAHGRFLTLVQKHFVEDDFVGNSLDLPYLVNREELGEGMQKGRILIDSDTNRLSLEVLATRHAPEQSRERQSLKRATAGIARDILSFRMGQCDGTALMKRCVPRIAALRRERGPLLALDLVEAYAYEGIGAKKAAADILRKWEEHDFGEEPATYEAAYLYLSTKLWLGAREQKDLREELRGLFSEDEDSLVILMILASIDPDYANRPGKVLTAMSRMYKNGNRSPFLYHAASELLKGNAHLLTALAPFARSVLLFGLRYGIADRDLALRAALLSENEKTFSPAVYRILTMAYRAYPLDDILEAVCKHIIKGNPRREEYHAWYERAVERDIRITRLYEYYMETLPDHYRKRLPSKVLRYFTLNNTLGAGKKALLFSNIIVNREQDPDTYREYSETMTDFAREMLLRGSMNEDFAIVYSEFIPSLPTREMAEAMAAVLFRASIALDDPRAREVVVMHEALRSEEVYPVYRGRAYADLYTDDAVILFQDERGRRFLAGAKYSVTPLMDVNAYAEACRRFGAGSAGLILNQLARDRYQIADEERNLREFMEAAFSEEFSDRFRSRLSADLLTYFSAHQESDSLDYFLSRIGSEPPPGGNHTLLIEIMVMRGMYREAFDLACKYGYEEMEPNLLRRLTGRMIALRDYAYDEELLLATATAFRGGAADKKTLPYLVAYFEGSIEEMTAVRKAAAAEGVDTRILEEKILRYAMFCRKATPDTDAVFRDFVSRGGNRKVCEAYLNFNAIMSFYTGRAMEPEVASALAGTAEHGSDLVRLALLRHYAESSELTAEEEKHRDSLFLEAVRKGYLFSFYRKLPLSLLQQVQLDDKLIVECRAYPTDRVMIRYRKPKTEGGEWIEEPMRRMCGGIFAKSFLLFDGEILRYRMIILRGEERTEGHEEALVMTAPDEGGRSRYQRINRMLGEEKRGEIGALAETIRKYRLAVHTVEKLFPLLETDSERKEEDQ